MTEITDAEATEVLWASSEQSKAAVTTAWETARRLDHCTQRTPASPPWSGTSTDQVSLDIADVAATVYAAYLAAGWDAGPDEPREHVHDWKVRNSANGISFNPHGGPSVSAAQTVALLRCAGCGDVASRILAGRWTLEDLQATGEQQR